MAEIMNRDRYNQLIQEFLGKRRIAIWGVEDSKGDPGQWIARRFRKRGIEVIEVNPKFAGNESLGRASSLTHVDPPVEAVLVYVDRPQTMEAIEDCLAVQIPLVWLHDALSPGAATPEAIDKLRAAGRAVIPGLCPMLYLKPVDPAHFCLKWLLRLTGKERRTRQAVHRHRLEGRARR
ncbi:MAG: CoA-binding protein [Verrucomicrobia bacterium]|nr:CoA-binding protein [Verrucomicrobiota bacterium]